MIFNNLIRSLLLGGALSFSALVQAAVCEFEVRTINLNGGGDVTTYVNNASLKTICSLKEEFQGVSVSTCAFWVNLLEKRLDQKKPIRIVYPNTSSYNTCDGFLQANVDSAPLSIELKASTGTTGSIPSAPSAVSPNGSISDTTPTFSWEAVVGATSYEVGLETLSGTDTVEWRQESMTVSQANCTSSSCSFNLTINSDAPVLESGSSYIWWVKAINSSGESSWGSSAEFTVN